MHFRKFSVGLRDNFITGTLISIAKATNTTLKVTNSIAKDEVNYKGDEFNSKQTYQLYMTEHTRLQILC